MNKIGILSMAFMLFAGLSFAWNTGFEPPSCATIYTALGSNFTLYNPSTSCQWSTSLLAGINVTSKLQNDDAYIGGFQSAAGGKTTIYVKAKGAGSGATTTSGGDIEAPNDDLSRTIEVKSSSGTVTFFGVTASTAGIPGTATCNLTSHNSTHLASNCTGSGAYIEKGKRYPFQLQVAVAGSGLDNSTLTIGVWNATSELKYVSPVNISLSGAYVSTNGMGGTLFSDFKSGGSSANLSIYCRALLYFNNPYYGNIQLISLISYVPGVEAYSYFYNSSSNAAFIRNNTMTYIFDSVTSAWYIVPASTCNDLNPISVATLQYDATSTGTYPSGSVPIDVSSISGSCSYASATRVITCTGADSSGTVSSLLLSAYLYGNTTDICNKTATGASGTLTCTLPAQNGTYNAYFYGIDTNLFRHQFSYSQITIGYDSAEYGRDGYIAVLLLFGICAMIATSNIALSMVLGCFGLFVALAFGILPISDAPVVVFFIVVALVIAYRLKV